MFTMVLDMYRIPFVWSTTSRPLAYARSDTLLQLSTRPVCYAIVEGISDESSEETGIDGFKWSLGLIARTVYERLLKGQLS